MIYFFLFAFFVRFVFFIYSTQEEFESTFSLLLSGHVCFVDVIFSFLSLALLPLPPSLFYPYPLPSPWLSWRCTNLHPHCGALSLISAPSQYFYKGDFLKINMFTKRISNFSVWREWKNKVVFTLSLACVTINIVSTVSVYEALSAFLMN